MLFKESLKDKGLEVARGIADWICNVQSPWIEVESSPGSIPFSVNHLGWRFPAPSWNYAFASMGLLGAYKAFGDERYKTAAIRLIEVLKTFQILDPFHKEHVGAIREHSPLCPWCYTRDSISGGWGLVEMYRFTGEDEYLERAKLFGQWLIRKGLDEEGYPWFGIQLDDPFHQSDLGHIKNDVQGNFQGGSLNFFYQLSKATGDASWCVPMGNIADIFVDHVQQDSGFFVSVFRDTKKPVSADDEYALLHRGNDDLGTLGLLCMYHVTQDEKYLASVKKFLEAAWSMQRDDGFFEDSVAATPVILNATYEAQLLAGVENLNEEKFTRGLEAMFSVQNKGDSTPQLHGALQEKVSAPNEVTMRANCYALILLLKLFAGVDEYLCD